MADAGTAYAGAVEGDRPESGARSFVLGDLGSIDLKRADCAVPAGRRERGTDRARFESHRPGC